MRVLALDVSSKTGYALMEGEVGASAPPLVLSYGVAANGCTVKEFGVDYPFNYLRAAEHMTDLLWELIDKYEPNAIVIEETNKARAVYSQKLLEFIHCRLLLKIRKERWAPGGVIYIQSENWRRRLGLLMSKEDKRNNAKVSKARKSASARGGTVAEAKKRLGVRGRITKKHLAVRYANARFGLELKQKDNDVADALCLGDAFFQNAQHCTGE